MSWESKILRGLLRNVVGSSTYMFSSAESQLSYDVDFVFVKILILCLDPVSRSCTPGTVSSSKTILQKTSKKLRISSLKCLTPNIEEKKI